MMRLPTFSVAALCAVSALLAAAPLHAQFPIPVTAGERTYGILRFDEPLLDGRWRGRDYVYRAEGPEHLVITVVSSSFDAMVKWGRKTSDSATFTHRNNNGLESNSGRDSKLVVAVPEAGEYWLRVQSAEPRDIGGEFTLRVDRGAPPSRTPSTGALEANSVEFQTLDDTDPLDEDGGNYDQYTIDAPVGKPLLVALQSFDFDAMLSLGEIANGRYQQSMQVDSGGPVTDAAFYLTPEAGRTYIIRATAAHRGDTGRYRLITIPVRTTAQTAGSYLGPSLPRRLREFEKDDLSVGRIGNAGDLSFSRANPFTPAANWFYMPYVYMANAGERMRITLTSDFFDSFLTVDEVIGGEPGTQRGATLRQIAHDDNSGGGAHAQLEITFPRAGRYVINVTSALPGAGTGPYKLRSEAL